MFPSHHLLRDKYKQRISFLLQHKTSCATSVTFAFHFWKHLNSKTVFIIYLNKISLEVKTNVNDHMSMHCIMIDILESHLFSKRFFVFFNSLICMAFCAILNWLYFHFCIDDVAVVSRKTSPVYIGATGGAVVVLV